MWNFLLIVMSMLKKLQVGAGEITHPLRASLDLQQIMTPKNTKMSRWLSHAIKRKVVYAHIDPKPLNLFKIVLG